MYLETRDNWDHDNRINLETSDPDFWGVWADDETSRKEATKKLDKWWKREKRYLPTEMPRARKLEKIFSSFKALKDENEPEVDDDMMTVACNPMWGASEDCVYLLLARHYECAPQAVRDIFYETNRGVF